MKRDVDRCLDCPRIVVRPSRWGELSFEQRTDSQFSRAIGGRCGRCYQRFLLMGRMRRDSREPRKYTTFCGCCGCWIFVGENCPNCEYELLNKENAA